MTSRSAITGAVIQGYFPNGVSPRQAARPSLQPKAAAAPRTPREIWDASYQFQRSVDSAEKVVVGVNAFQLEKEDPFDILYIDESVTGEQIASLNHVRATRDARRVEETLQTLRNTAADPNANTMPYIIDAVKAYATVGEISDAFRDAFGTYQEPALF